MWDILLDFLAYLGIRSLRKKRREDAESPSPDTIDPSQEQDHSGGETRESNPVCAGCNRIVERGATYELGKAWCQACYKSKVLKIQE